MKINYSKLLLIALFTASFAVLFPGCTKENSGNGTDQQEEEVSRVSSESDAEAEMVFNGVFDDAMGVNDEVGMAGTGIFGRNNIGSTTGTPETQRPNACFTITV